MLNRASPDVIVPGWRPLTETWVSLIELTIEIKTCLSVCWRIVWLLNNRFWVTSDRLISRNLIGRADYLFCDTQLVVERRWWSIDIIALNFYYIPVMTHWNESCKFRHFMWLMQSNCFSYPIKNRRIRTR